MAAEHIHDSGIQDILRLAHRRFSRLFRVYIRPVKFRSGPTGAMVSTNCGIRGGGKQQPVPICPVPISGPMIICISIALLY